MDNCDAVKFYVDVIIEMRKSYGLPTNDRQTEDTEQIACRIF